MTATRRFKPILLTDDTITSLVSHNGRLFASAGQYVYELTDAFISPRMPQE